MKNKKNLWLSILILALFALWTLLISVADVQPIGPNGSAVGLAQINGWFHKLTGANMTLYHITDWLGLVPVAFGFGFAVLGLKQWIQRKHILKVDRSILVLGLYYILVLAAYLLFEEFVINYRPVLIAGYLEASYPSSTTLLVLSVMPTLIFQARLRLHRPLIKQILAMITIAFSVFMVIGRLISGVHWITDIIGSLLLSSGLFCLYLAAVHRFCHHHLNNNFDI